MTSSDLNLDAIETAARNAARIGSGIDPGTVIALVAEVRRLHTAAALLKDAEHYLSALHGSVARHDNLAANLGCAGCELRDKIRAALAAEPTAAAEQPAEACGKCRRPFDPADTRFDGAARYRETPYCRRCIDVCHESADAFHRCVICVPETGE